ncbi:hypothetical protein GQ44DRAFT_699587 [Phaeosphaeriaceae sp. PMI808]|nr:hypothetical protein GQ44DRAFT_699587 [Phaeosphaeriaceae sp. PMI808]
MDANPTLAGIPHAHTHLSHGGQFAHFHIHTYPHEHLPSERRSCIASEIFRSPRMREPRIGPGGDYRRRCSKRGRYSYLVVGWDGMGCMACAEGRVQTPNAERGKLPGWVDVYGVLGPG